MRSFDSDWREAVESAVESLRCGELAEWELHLITRRVENAIAIEAAKAGETANAGSMRSTKARAEGIAQNQGDEGK